MADYSLVSAALALCILHQASSQDPPAVLTITPSSLTLSPTQADTTGGSVTVVCKPPSSAGLLYALRIHRKVGNTNTPLVTTDPPNPQDATYDGTARLLLTSGGYSVSGGKLDRSITLVMARAKCSEAAEYICKVTSGSTGTTLNHEKKLNLTVDVVPKNITLTPSPLQSAWQVNETLEITCNGIVGSVTDKTVIEWQWEYQQRSEFGDFPIHSWKPYSESSSYDPADIQTESMIPGSSDPNSCYKRQTSILFRVLQEEDNRREYRCYMIRDGRSYDSYAKIHYVGTVTATASTSSSVPIPQTIPTPSATPTPSSTTLSSSTNCQTSEGVGKGIVIGIAATFAVFFVVIIVAVVWLWRRQWMLPCAETKTKQENTETGQRESTEATLTTVQQNVPVLRQPVPSQVYVEASEATRGPYEELRPIDVGLKSIYTRLADQNYQDATSTATGSLYENPPP